MKLYLSALAPNPDRVRLFLQEKGVMDQLDVTNVDLMKGEHRSGDYKTVSPFSQVPALVLDDGTALTESRAICTFLEGEFPNPNLMGETPKERAIIEMWDRRVELLYLMSVAQWFRHGHPAAIALENPQVAEWSKINEWRARKIAEFFDSRLGESPFVAGERFTVADITLFIAMGFGKIMKFEGWKDRPNLTRWMEWMQARPALTS